MLRMLLASEHLDALVGPPAPTESPRGQIQLKANVDINTGDPSWFDNLLANIAEHRLNPIAFDCDNPRSASVLRSRTVNAPVANEPIEDWNFFMASKAD